MQHTDDIHMTLVFVGRVDDERLAALQRIAGGFQSPGFDLSLKQLAYWSRPQILCALPATPPKALLQLQASLSERLRKRLGITIDSVLVHLSGLFQPLQT